MTRRQFMKISGKSLAGLTLSASMLSLFGCSQKQVDSGAVATWALPQGLLVVNADLCTGCQRCEINCTLTNDGVCSSYISRVKIQRRLNLDGAGKSDIRTGCGFLDHMLTQIAHHGGVALAVDARGDLDIDEHHTMEDVAITLGEAIDRALETYLKKGYSEECAEYMAQRLIDLIDHMQYGYALIAFHKQGTIFKMVKATLMPYESFFHRFYEMERIESTVVYWDVESQAWRSFQLENLLDWSPVC